MRYIRRNRIAMVAVLTLFLIATSSTNSAPSSLQGEATIPNYATISWRFEIELMGTSDILSLDNELDIYVLGNVQQTPRYGVSGEAWVDGVWISSHFFDTTLSDRFVVKCTEEKAINMSSYVWVEWTAPVLKDDQKLQPPHEESSIFFEYGAESGVLEPPWDLISQQNGAKVTIVSSPVHAGTKAVKLGSLSGYTGIPRAQLNSWQNHPSEVYMSYWCYFPNEYDLSSSGWDLVFDMHAMIPEFTGSWYDLPKCYLKKSTNHPPFVLMAPPQIAGSWTRSSTAVPRNQWVHFQMYYKVGVSDGIYRVWQDDKLIFDYTNVDTATTHGGVATRIYCMEVKYYSSDGDPRPNWKFVDDIVFATEKVPESYGVIDK